MTIVKAKKFLISQEYKFICGASAEQINLDSGSRWSPQGETANVRCREVTDVALREPIIMIYNNNIIMWYVSQPTVNKPSVYAGSRDRNFTFFMRDGM